jgi:putative transposase
MSRVARIVVPGFPHHVTQRGNRRSDVFESDDDRQAYLRFLRQYADRHGLAVWAYCLMTNHVHLVVVPEREDSLAKALRDTHTVYAMRFNARTRLGGHLWQGRFYSCPMDESHLWAALRYVERNPVRAGLVARAEDYRWSSAPAHCQNAGDPVLSKEFPPPGVIADWAQWLETEDDEHVDRIRMCTRVGRPCGAAPFATRLEALLNRSLQPKPRGRRPKPKEATADAPPETSKS